MRREVRVGNVATGFLREEACWVKWKLEEGRRQEYKISSIKKTRTEDLPEDEKKIFLEELS